MISLQKGIVFLIAIFVVGVIMFSYFGPQGLLAFLPGWVANAGQLLPQNSNTEIPEHKQDKSFSVFFTEFTKLIRDSNGEKCYISYPKPSEEEFAEFKVQLLMADGDIHLRKRDPSGAIANDIPPDPIKGKEICIISPEEFYDNYLQSSPDPQPYKQDYVVLQDIQFGHNTIVADKSYDLSDGGILYKPEKDKVCFIPTEGDGIWSLDFGDCHRGSNALDDDCMSQIRERLPSCNDVVEDVGAVIQIGTFNKFTTLLENIEKEVENTGYCHLIYDFKDLNNDYFVHLEKNNDKMHLHLRTFQNDIITNVNSQPMVIERYVPFTAVAFNPTNTEEVKKYMKQRSETIESYAILPQTSSAPVESGTLRLNSDTKIVLIHLDGNWILAKRNDVISFIGQLGPTCEFQEPESDFEAELPIV